MTGDPQITRLLSALESGGDPCVRAELLPLVYERMRDIARGQLVRERAGHTLQPTALVHEAWVRLVGSPPGELRDSVHFFGVVAEAMRRVLVDHARARAAEKRGGGARARSVTFADLEIASPDPSLGLVELDDALRSLAVEDERSARAVELRFFVGLDTAQTAEVLGVSEPTVKRDLAFARAFLHDVMGSAD